MKIKMKKIMNDGRGCDALQKKSDERCCDVCLCARKVVRAFKEETMH